MNNMFERTKLLVGKPGFQALKKARVMVVGVGGVGSICAESLARSGVGKIVIVDNDLIDITNLNRQIQTRMSNIGKSKVKEMANYINDISLNTEVKYHELFFNKKHAEIFDDVDFVIDAIDTIFSKADLIEICLEKNIPFISSMGMGNRLDPSQVFETTLDKT